MAFATGLPGKQQVPGTPSLLCDKAFAKGNAPRACAPPAVLLLNGDAGCSGLRAEATESSEAGIFQRATRELNVWIPFAFQRRWAAELCPQVHFPVQLRCWKNAALRGICPLASQLEGAKSNISGVYQTDGQGTSTELSQESQDCYHKPILSFDFENMFFLLRRNIR